MDKTNDIKSVTSLRLSDNSRLMLTYLTKKLKLDNASETLRYLILKEYLENKKFERKINE